jgi:dTMP kinase
MTKETYTQKTRFITFEGGEGAGKSTQIKQLSAALTAANIDHIVTREPGGSPGGEAIRKLVVNSDGHAWHPTTESLLFMAARYDHVETVIKPALARGAWVLCDRFYDSTYVYQGIAKQVGTAWLDALYTTLFANTAPDLTLLLDIDPEIGLARTQTRGNTTESRFEQMGIDFHRLIRLGFLQLSLAHPNRIHALDASVDADTLHQAVLRALNHRFGVGL